MRISLIFGLVLAGMPVVAQDAQEGEGLFMTYCATCHGLDATGGGPMAEMLATQPPDLTAISLGNNGVFPTERIVFRIDGRDSLTAHGGPMPLFGGFFEGTGASVKAPDGQPVLTSVPVADLVVWLESVQQ
jgi:mono/diheme cytochrome c family protein